jgi:hypothetical protein
MLLVLDVLLIVFYYLILRVFSVYLSLYSMYMIMSISIGPYPNMDLWNANKLRYISLHIKFTIPICNDAQPLLIYRRAEIRNASHNV